VGERLWLRFFVLQSFAGRMAWKTVVERDRGEFYTWRRDPQGKPDHFMFATLARVAPEEIMQTVKDTKQTLLPERILQYLEGELLIAMNDLIFGRRLIDDTIEQYQRLDGAIPRLFEYGTSAFKRNEKSATSADSSVSSLHS